MNEAEEREMDRALKLDQKKLEDLGAFDAQKCGSYDMHVEARLDEAMWWAHNATNGHITDKAMKRIEGLRGAAPAPPPVSALRERDYIEYSEYASNSVLQNKMPMPFQSWITGRNG